MSTEPWSVGSIRVRRIRGPREDGMVYWRATIPDHPEEPKRWCYREDSAWCKELLAIQRGEEQARINPEVPRMLLLLGRYRAELDARVANNELKARSRETYRQALRYLTTGLADVAIAGLDVDVIRSYCRDRAAGRIQPEAIKHKGKSAAGRFKASPRTIAGEIDVLRAAWMWGRRKGLADRPLDVPRLGRIQGVRDKYTPTEDEVEAVVGELRQPWQRALTELLLHTGARIGEIAALTWGNVDLDRGVLTLDGKTGPRQLPILEEVADVFAELGPIASPTCRVLPVTFTTAKMALGPAIAEACIRAGVPRWTPHGLRRLAVDRLYERYREVSVVSRLLGQSPVVALRYYRTPSLEVLRAALTAASMGTGRKVLRMARVTTGVTAPPRSPTNHDH